MKTYSALLFLVLVALCQSGCKGFGVVQLSGNTYMASKTSGGGVFKSMASLKAEVISKANEFAEKQGKVAVPISTQETPAAPFQNPSFEYQFMLVDKNDPRATGQFLTPRADVVVEKSEKISADIHADTRTKAETPKQPDLYTELMKLDELRKKGLITDAEFEAQKQKLLNNAK